MRFARGIIKDHSTPISALLVEDGHQRATCPSDRIILLRSPILLRPKSLERDPVSHRERTARVRTGYSRLATLACFQKNAGVNIAKRIEPMVAWSSARMEAVWGMCQLYQGQGPELTHVVTRPVPAVSGCRFVAMRGSNILEPTPSRQTYREESTRIR
jgi:hypothetical protein